MRRNDEAVAAVVGALLVLSALVSFLVVYRLEWAPVFVENREGDASAALQEALLSWASTGEGLVNEGSVNRTFTKSLPIGVSTGLFTGAERSGGAAQTETGPTLTIFHNATQVARKTGSLRVDADYREFPNQTLRYSFGAIELTQASGTWVDLRGLLVAQRSNGGMTGLALMAVGVEGSPRSLSGGSSVDAVGHVISASAATHETGTVRLLVEGVRADAWRAAFERVLSSASLEGETATNCAASALAWCLESATNTPSTVDLYLRNVAKGWSTVTGTVRVELRA